MHRDKRRATEGGRLFLRLLSIAGAFLISASAWGQGTNDAKDNKPADPDTGESTVEERTLGVLPNPYINRGIKFGLTTIDEVLANPAGGAKRGAIYEGRTSFAVDLDFEKLWGWSDTKAHANVFQIRGQGLSREYVGNFMLASGIEAVPTLRLYEAWLERTFMNEKVAVRLGQLAADTEFINSHYADVFTNSTFGWPAMLGIILPAGGPSPPLAVPGIRLKAKITDDLIAEAAIFDGNIAGPGAGDPQSRDLYGLNFRVSDPPLVIAELQYSYDQHENSKLPGTVKVGAWHHQGSFQDQRFDANNVSLANPASSGTPKTLHTDFGFYAVLDQSIYHFSKHREIGVFGRISTAPADRNLIDFYADGGLEFIEPIPGRRLDKFGIGFAYARLSPSAQNLDRDFETYRQTPGQIRDAEALVMASYEAEITKGWSLLPSFQYIMHPSGGYTDPTMPGRNLPLKNASVFGLRSTLKF
jgi:porin